MVDVPLPSRREETIDWSQTTHEGNRRRQHLEFLALSLREKILRVEQMCEVAEHFQRRREMPEEPRRNEGTEGHDRTS